ncbi:MAG TPA: ribonuclease E inhibitor RraB [Povalibacter sp.]|uniref:ribonuclease E inhibitor RraB n=1 Tax=Povalibacter sp. TaxID=1962978 RepID=UPI002C967CA8|nr:ribonuclease E inhibitor RraB [Povalibacter sp.]HMN44521.1 ribonuclease E inhibitor RraB [Povalibacter sp.]
MIKSRNYDRNIAVVKALRDAGADFRKQHALEHHLYCYTQASFELVQSLGIRLGYSVAHEGKHEDEQDLWSLDLVKRSAPDIESVERQSLEIEEIAERANAKYDGWGTEVEQ